MFKKNADLRDIPLLANDMLSPASTMDKPLDTADAPGKADSEIADSEIFTDAPAASIQK